MKALRLLFVLAIAVAAPQAAADMQIRLKDGRVLTLPVAPEEIDSITFGARKPGPATGTMQGTPADNGARTPAERAAEQLRRQSPAERPAAQPAPRPPGASTAETPAGRTLTVGPGGQFALPSAAAKAARDGDVIEIRAGEYSGDVAVWKAHNLTIRGVGGRPRLDAAGKSAEGKAIWVIRANNATVENIEFSGCRVRDLNGAGIRLEGTGLTVRRSRFVDNEIGIMTGTNRESDVLVEYSEFARNRIDYERYEREGRKVSREIDPGHNIYIGRLRSFTLRFSYMHHAVYGHNVKSRARRNVIAYNRIADERDGQASYAIDLPEGGLSLIVGNVIQQGEKTDNSTVVSHGAERPDASPLYVINNTFVNDRHAGIFVRRSKPGPTIVLNNIFDGGGTVLAGGGTLRSNLIIERQGFAGSLFGGGDGKARPGTGALAGNIVASTAMFVDAAALDVRLKPDSPAIDAGENPGKLDDMDLSAAFQYRHPSEGQPRTPVGRIDIGAYEFSTR